MHCLIKASLNNFLYFWQNIRDNELTFLHSIKATHGQIEVLIPCFLNSRALFMKCLPSLVDNINVINGNAASFFCKFGSFVEKYFWDWRAEIFYTKFLPFDLNNIFQQSYRTCQKNNYVISDDGISIIMQACMTLLFQEQAPRIKKKVMKFSICLWVATMERRYGSYRGHIFRQD